MVMRINSTLDTMMAVLCHWAEPFRHMMILTPKIKVPPHDNRTVKEHWDAATTNNHSPHLSVIAERYSGTTVFS